MFTNEELAQAIRVAIDSVKTKEFHRPYLGMSQIGHSCTRYLWYKFRWAKTGYITARKARIFSRGHHEEPRLIKILETAGISVSESQTPFEDIGSHFRGHLDAVLFNVPGIPDKEILGEFKTINEKSWKKLSLNKLFETNKQYWAQVQLYMFYRDLEKCLFVAVNKNTEELYFELIDLDLETVHKLQNRAAFIIEAEIPPQRTFDSPSYYECNWCEFKSVCWENNNYDINCRTCKYSKPADVGTWECTLKEFVIPLDVQRIGCDSYDSIKS